MYENWNAFATAAFGAPEAALSCSLPSPDLLRVTGDEAVEFLAGQLINTLPAHGDVPRYNGYCSAQGRLIATMMVWRDGHGFWLHCDAGLGGAVTARLTKYILRARVQIEEVRGWAAIGLIGQAWRAVFPAMGGPADDAKLDVAPDVTHTEGRPATSTPDAPGDMGSANEPLFMYAMPGEVPCLIVLAHDVVTLEKRIMIRAGDSEAGEAGAGDAEAGDATDFRSPVGRLSSTAIRLSGDTAHNAWDVARIYGGVPVITPHTTERFIPQVVHVDALGGMSLDKGCYPGQEIIARLHYKGQRKSDMVICRACTSTTPRAGETVFAVPDNGGDGTGGGRAVGTVVSSARLDNDHIVLQAVLPITTVAAQARMQCESVPGVDMVLCP